MGSKLCIETNLYLGKDVIDHLPRYNPKKAPLGKSIIQDLLKRRNCKKSRYRFVRIPMLGFCRYWTRGAADRRKYYKRS